MLHKELKASDRGRLRGCLGVHSANIDLAPGSEASVVPRPYRAVFSARL